MAESTLTAFSNQLADAVAGAERSVVQVQGRRQPASGIVYAPDVVITTTRAIGREDGLIVRTPDGRAIEAELSSWDPATHLVALRAPGLELPAAKPAEARPRVGNIGIAVARSWSNALTATAGLVSVIGGPLPTGRGRAIDEIIRTSAPMHRGFAGGAFVNSDGQLLGVATAVDIRGLGVVIPAGIAWKTVAGLLEHGRARRGYLGVAAQSVTLTPAQRDTAGSANGVLVMRVMDDSPAARAGVLVGDILTALDDVPLDSPDRLLEALASRGGATVTVRILRGTNGVAVSVGLGEK